jgi:hypothetical protein
MEFVIAALGVWLVASLAVALLFGRVLRGADRRERRTTVTDGSPVAMHQTRLPETAGVHETA